MKRDIFKQIQEIDNPQVSVLQEGDDFGAAEPAIDAWEFIQDSDNVEVIGDGWVCAFLNGELVIMEDNAEAAEEARQIFSRNNSAIKDVDMNVFDALQDASERRLARIEESLAKMNLKIDDIYDWAVGGSKDRETFKENKFFWIAGVSSANGEDDTVLLPDDWTQESKV